MKDTDKAVDGQSFYAEHLTGSGTITPDGTYAEPEPDPTVRRGGPSGEHTSPGGVRRADPAAAPEPTPAPAAKRASNR